MCICVFLYKQIDMHQPFFLLRNQRAARLLVTTQSCVIGLDNVVATFQRHYNNPKTIKANSKTQCTLLSRNMV